MGERGETGKRLGGIAERVGELTEWGETGRWLGRVAYRGGEMG